MQVGGGYCSSPKSSRGMPIIDPRVWRPKRVLSSNFPHSLDTLMHWLHIILESAVEIAFSTLSHRQRTIVTHLSICILKRQGHGIPCSGVFRGPGQQGCGQGAPRKTPAQGVLSNSGTTRELLAGRLSRCSRGSQRPTERSLSRRRQVGRRDRPTMQIDGSGSQRPEPLGAPGAPNARPARRMQCRGSSLKTTSGAVLVKISLISAVRTHA